MLERLTTRKKQVAMLVGNCWSTKDIAFQCHLKEGSVKTMLSAIYRKLEFPKSRLNNKLHLARIVWEETDKTSLCKNCQAELFNEVLTNGNNR